MNIDKKAAAILLKQRKKGWSIIYAIKVIKIRFISYMALIIVAIFLKTSSTSLNSWFLIFIGIIIGAFIRDIGWLIRIKKSWPFTEKITDWNKVKEIAENK